MFQYSFYLFIYFWANGFNKNLTIFFLLLCGVLYWFVLYRIHVLIISFLILEVILYCMSRWDRVLCIRPGFSRNIISFKRKLIFFSPLFNFLFLFLYIKIYKLTTFSDYYYKKHAWSTPNSFIRSYQIIIPVYVVSTPLATK